MRLTFLGGADEVGASGTLIEIAGKKLLVDAGIRISAKQRRAIGDDQLPDLRLISEAGGPDAILVTHAHTDHTGALPLVMEQYPHVPVIATEPTIALIRILQADAQRIMKTRQEQESELPLFDEISVQRLLDAFQTVEFRHTLKLGENLQATYHPSGHIVGAASLLIESDEGVLVMSGDVSLTPQRAVVRAAIPNVKADGLVLESTYGGKLHANRAAEEKRLIDTLRGVIARGGRALIPAFALGRAQEVIQILLANRGLIDAPIYVDGMVRSVCRAYVRFPDWLPSETVKTAGDDPLFFRNKVLPIETQAQRMEIANTALPCVIVSSSGMLTGGPSAVYAKALAADARNAILLTGYQDEESPGRALQRAIKERQEGDEVTIRIDGQPVTVRCDLGTYSLSAHADEGELVSVAESFDAEQIALVHGDPGARQSLANALRARGRIVRMPISGQALEWEFEKKPWRLAKSVQGAHPHATKIDAKALWEALAGRSGDFYSAQELAQMWYGDAARANAVAAALMEDAVYFSPDWRQRGNFQVHSPEQVTQALRRRAIMLANPDLAGKWIVLRDSNNRPRVGVVQQIDKDGFDAFALNAKGRHYPADALLWVIGTWGGARNNPGLTGQLNDRFKAARALQETLLPFERRQLLVAAAQPIDPAALIPDALPDDIDRDTALLSIVLTLAADGAQAVPGGLLPKRAFDGEPLEQNAARQVALEAFPPPARLRKVGIEVHRKRLSLTFDFPERAEDAFADQIEHVIDQTGWDVYVNRQVNQQALGAAVIELLPAGAQIVKGPSFFLDRREVQVEISHIDDADALEQAYFDLTSYRLRVNSKANGGSEPAAVPSPARPTMEINTAYGVIREALNPFGLMKCSLKQGQIVLMFISPQVGQRYTDIIARLAEKTGYAISLHPHPDQNAIAQKVTQIVREAGWQMRKNLALLTDRGEVVVTASSAPSEEQIEQLNLEIAAATGYKLVVKA
ncbi:MAG: MBL fold metallo-hydrolase [Anaerolineae bacterium]|nr:MBL fold metallo-hydrolase [Anaerolineae bacterium]NUQ06416.1 MBL fold metallo-hydrolase [Anaerolineae bacterium]